MGGHEGDMGGTRQLQDVPAVNSPAAEIIREVVIPMGIIAFFPLLGGVVAKKYSWLCAYGTLRG